MSDLTSRIELRLTPAEKKAWEDKAVEAGISISDLIRHAVGGTPLRSRKRVVVDPTLLRQLAQIGNNLNQLARWANRDKGGVEALAVIARLIEINREVSVLRKAGGAQLDGAYHSTSDAGTDEERQTAQITAVLDEHSGVS